ncbi:MAG TPA: alpha/beta fold hydrolase [Gallionellaceae bacterium]|nr:alpha/beta fold hydrolase [Gallionellaceae bacterium]
MSLLMELLAIRLGCETAAAKSLVIPPGEGWGGGSLHVEAQGSGKPILLIHGWGMHGGMWGRLPEQLAQSCRAYSVDLPGHGFSSLPSPASGRGAGGEGSEQGTLSPSLSRERERGLDSLDAIVTQLRAQFGDEPLTLCGWSLGGQVAMRWAQQHPGQVEKLVLLATTPCFVRRDGWDCAMSGDTLQQFAEALLQNHAQTLRRFLALQVRGSENERELLTVLREQLFSRGEPDVAALKVGLDILRDADMRAALPEIKQPTLLVAGERDTITPLGAAQYAAQALPSAQLLSIKGAAHAPFLSHRDEVVKHMLSFMRG